MHVLDGCSTIQNKRNWVKMSEFNFFEERIKIAQMNKSQPIPFSEIIIEAGMVKAF